MKTRIISKILQDLFVFYKKLLTNCFQNVLTRTPVRDSGQPIYDAAHRPCSGSPRRARVLMRF